MYRKIKINQIDQIFDTIPGIRKGETRHSIPDVYGRAIRLGIILAEFQGKEEKELPNEIREWRGIITLLALKDFLNLDIQIESIPLCDLRNDKNAFGKAITLTPKRGVVEELNWNWETYHIIKIRKDGKEMYQDIALFSPSTLVYPIADINEVMPKLEGVSWFTSEGFANPVNFLNKEQQQVVYYWLQMMIENLRSISNKMRENMIMAGQAHKQDAISVIIKQLQMYCSQLISGTGKCFELCDITSGLSGAEAYKCINQTVKVKVYIGNKEFYFKETFADDIQCIKGRTEDNIFNNCINKEKHRINHGNVEETTSQMYAILPLGKKIVEEITDSELEELSKYVEMWWLDKKRVAVRIYFSSINSQNMDITKEFVCTDEGLWDDNDAQLVLWPKIKSQSWGRYYLYFYKGGRNFDVCGNTEKKKKRTGGYVYEYKGYPFKIEFEKGNETNKKYLGILLPQAESYVENGNRTAEVAIDFGTSATVCFAKIDGLGEREIFFRQENSLLLLKGYSEKSVTQVAQNFIPLDIEETRMYSVYKAFNNNIVDNVEPILDGVIYYAKNMEIIPEDMMGERYLTNLKWMMNTDGIWYQNFICQLCMQITLYLKRLNVGTINWKYALPLSLEQKEREKVRNVWDVNIDLLKGISGMSHDLKDMISESQAISNYFYKHNAVDNIVQLYEEAGYIIVDIGGGSTDFSMWQKRNGESKMWETSVPVASRKLFSEVVFSVIHNISDFYALKDKRQEQLREIEQLGKGGKEQLAIAFLEKFIADNSKDIQNKIRLRENDPNCTWLNSFRNRLSMGAAMVLYCAGQMLGEKLKSGDVVERPSETFYVVLAGNGSNLYEWVFEQSWEETNEKTKFVNVFLEGVRSRYGNIRMEVRIVKSLQTKQEVAQGLLLSNVSISQEGFQKGNYSASQILNWKDRFVYAYRENFADASLEADTKWNNIAARAADECEDSCNILLQNIFKHLCDRDRK